MGKERVNLALVAGPRAVGRRAAEPQEAERPVAGRLVALLGEALAAAAAAVFGEHSQDREQAAADAPAGTVALVGTAPVDIAPAGIAPLDIDRVDTDIAAVAPGRGNRRARRRPSLGGLQ